MWRQSALIFLLLSLFQTLQIDRKQLNLCKSFYSRYIGAASLGRYILSLSNTSFPTLINLRFSFPLYTMFSKICKPMTSEPTSSATPKRDDKAIARTQAKIVATILSVGPDQICQTVIDARAILLQTQEIELMDIVSMYFLSCRFRLDDMPGVFPRR